MSDGPTQQVQVEISPETEVGVYANFLLVAAGEHDFILDFCQVMPKHQEDDAPVTVRVVSRIRIAPSFVGPLLQAISQNAFQRDERIRQIEQEGGDQP